MKQDKAVYALGTWSVGLALGSMAACAGGDTPARTSELEEQIAVRYAGGQVGAAAAGGGSGVGGSGTGGSGTGGSGGASTGSGGGMMAGNAGGGGSSSGGCDGFGILKAKCGNGPCHDQQQSGSLSNFVLDEATAEAFVDEPSTSCASSDNAPVFDPDNPAASLVIKKILDTSACGGRMPLGAMQTDLTPSELTCVQDWIGTL